ncbi:hypothetical protein ACOSQ4_010321 [Xanthoceras sorbifolium]
MLSCMVVEIWPWISLTTRYWISANTLSISPHVVSLTTRYWPPACPHVVSLTTRYWSPPTPHPSMCFNLNVDASCYTVKRRVGIGIVVRNDKGEAIFAATVPVSHCGAIEVAEARTVLVSRS